LTSEGWGYVTDVGRDAHIVFDEFEDNYQRHI
jgi:hypothetical protein